MSQYRRVAEHALTEIFEIIDQSWQSQIPRATVPSGFTVGVSSVRLKLFCQDWRNRQSVRCRTCGIQATHFAVEGFLKQPDSVHLNLYARVKRGDILFTKDHRVPRSRGGSNGLNNMQVMCQPCNSRKGNKLE